MYKFQNTEYFFALVAIPFMLLIYFLAINWKKKTIKKIGDERLVKQMIKNYSAQKFALKFLLIITAFASGVFALANLRTPTGSEKVNRNGVDVMIALDVSKSMLAQDIKPSRLDRAKNAISKLIDKLNNDRIGIVVFAGKSYLQMPLTGDIGAAKMYLSSATPEIVPTQGTVISDALNMCYNSFNTKEKKYKSVILISDGEDHDEEAINVAEKMAEEGVIIHTIGIGSTEGTTIIDPATGQAKADNLGNIVVTKLNETTLKTIAEKGKGTYQLYTNTDDVVNNLKSEISGMGQRTVVEDSLVNYKSYFQYFLALALLLLVIEMIISENKKKTFIKKNMAPKLPLAVTLLPITFFLIPKASFSQNEKPVIKKGNVAYNKNKFENATNEYKKALTIAPSNSTAFFNLGNALYKNNKAEDAIINYDNAITNTKNINEKATAFYNKGVALQNNKKLPECIEAYKNALKLNPQDEDARQNLQKALQQQQQQKQPKDKKDDKKKQDQKQKEDEKKKNKEDEQPKPQPSKITKKDAEEKLKALLQQEKNLQDKLKKANQSSPNKPEKDW